MIVKGGDHEQGKVHAARDIARENGVADMPAPYGKTLALSFFEIAAADDSPPSVTRKYPSTRFYLVFDLYSPKHPPNPSGSPQSEFESSRIHVQAISRNVPATGEDDACTRRGEVEHRLCRS